jgi:hypothetical protein
MVTETAPVGALFDATRVETAASSSPDTAFVNVERCPPQPEDTTTVTERMFSRGAFATKDVSDVQ